MKAGLQTALAALLLTYTVTHAATDISRGMVAQTTGTDFNGGNLMVTYLSNNNRVTVRSGHIYGPCFSPDGKKISYGDENAKKICIINLDGSGRTEIAAMNGGDEPTTAWARNGYIYYACNSGTIDRVRPDGSGHEVVFRTNYGGSSIHKLGLSSDGTRAAWTCVGPVNVHVAELPDLDGSSERDFGSGCQGSVSPNGSYVTHNLGGHRTFRIHRWDGSTYKNINCAEGRTGNVHSFSHHVNDVVVYIEEGSNAGIVMNIENLAFRRIGHGIPADYFPSEVTAGPSLPRIALSQTSVSFTGWTNGDVTPEQVVVDIQNSTAGTTLESVSVTSKPSWVTATVSGSGNDQDLTLTVNASALSEGTHSGTVTVQASNAEPQTAELTVSAEVKSPPVFTALAISPRNPSVQPGGSIQLTAVATDQHGDDMPLPGTVQWSVAGGGSISAAGELTAPASEGTVTVTAALNGKTATVEVIVADVPPVHIRINAGGGTVSGWESGETYLVTGSEGAAYDFGQDGDVTGVENAAPAALYSTVRHENHAYSFTNLRDGTYTVRFHFCDTYGGDRSMTYSIEGTAVLSQFNPAAEAGVGKALVKDFTVTVSDGNGLQIVGDKAGGNDVFEAGIEVFNDVGTVTGPPITVISPNGGESFRAGEPMTITYTSSCDSAGPVKLELSLDEGESWTLVVNESMPCGEDQQWEFTIPESLSVYRSGAFVNVSAQSTQCLVRVLPYMGSASINDVSDAVFTIQAPVEAPVRSSAEAGSGMTATFAVEPHAAGLLIMVPDAGTVDVVAADGSLMVHRRVDSGQRSIVIDERLAAGAYFARFRGTAGDMRAVRFMYRR